MPENGGRKLTLHSPAGSEHAMYPWPFVKSDTWDEALEIVETIRWVCHDFPELKLAVENYVLNDFDPKSFDSMKTLCERYNRAVDNIKKLWSGRQPPECIDSLPSMPLLKHILIQVYNRAVTNPETLNCYEPFSPEVYGETSFELVAEVIKHTHLTENDIFVDLGSGIGQVVLQVAAATGCKCYGIEKAETPALYAKSMESEFIKWMDFYGKSYGDFELVAGDFLDEGLEDIINSATVIFVNNFAFGPKLNHELKMKFSNLADGTKIVSSHEFCPLNFRITTRNLSDIGSMMHVAELSPLKGHVSWTGKPVTYYLHVIDRGKLEKFFRRQKHPEEVDSEESSRSPTPCRERGQSVGMDSRGMGSTECTDRPLSLVRPGVRGGGGRKRERVLMSDESEESSLDSSDNDFEEQIRKLKSQRQVQQQQQQQQQQSGQKRHSQPTSNSLPPGQQQQKASSHSFQQLPSPDSQDSVALGGASFRREPQGQKSVRKYQRALSASQQKSTLSMGGSNGNAGGPRKPGRVGKKERKKDSSEAGGSNSSLLGHGGVSKRRGSRMRREPMEGLFGSIQGQLSSYMQQLGSAEHQGWVRDAIEKEKLKQQHLQVVIQHLESEVSNLAKETISQMEESMAHLGITTYTPEGLLVGAKAIVHQNRKLRIEMKELEKELNSLRDQNQVMEVLCKDRNVPLPQANVSLPGGLPSTSNEPRVPPLPNELITAAAPADSAAPLPVVNSGKRSKAHGSWKSVSGHVTPSLGPQQKQDHKQQKRLKGPGPMDRDPEEVAHPALNMEFMHSLKGVTKCEVLTVQDCSPAGITEDLAKEVKECKIELERIDQELLELGPFAKELYHELSPSRRGNPIILPPGMVAPPPHSRGGVVATTPDLFIHHYQQHPSPVRRQRKVNRQSSSNKLTSAKDASASKKKSEDGYASSPMSTSSVSLGDERSEVADRPLAKDRDREGKEQQQQLPNPQKGKWRKVGSAGSPVVPPTQPLSSKTAPMYPQSNLVGSNSSSPQSDSVHQTSPAASSSARERKVRSNRANTITKDLDADVNSPSMIPAASEIEMLSLYMPNSPWETIGSSPLHSDHGSTPDMHAAIENGSSAEKSAEGHQRTESDVSFRSYSSPLGASQNALKTDKPNAVEGSPQAETPPQKPPGSTNSYSIQNSGHWQSPLTNSVARHSPEQTASSHSETREVTSDANHRAMPQAPAPPTQEIKRHVVVRDGTPVCMPSSAPKQGFSMSHSHLPHGVQEQHHQQQQQQPSPQYHHHHSPATHVVREHRSATPIDHAPSPTGYPHPHLGNVDVSTVKHRRTSSSSSLRSLKQQHSLDDGVPPHSLPSPLPAHSRVSSHRQTSSPLTQQALQQVHLLGGASVGDMKQPNSMLVGSEASKLAMMNAAGGMPWLAGTSAAGSPLAAQSSLLGTGSVPSAINASGLPCYPFSFLPGGGSWLPTPGGMLAATAGLPSPLRPPMLSLDPNSPYKPVFNPLLPYRYPLSVTQSLKNFPSTTSPQVSQAPGINQTSSDSVTPQSAVYPVTPSPNLSAFHTVGSESIGAGGRTSQANSATPPLLCLQPGQTQGFHGVLPPPVLIGTGAEDNSSSGSGTTKCPETSVAAPPQINWMQNPAALIGSGTNFMPYLMGQPQFGIAGGPGSQQAVSLLANSPLAGGASAQPALHGSDSNLANIGALSASNTGAVLTSKDHPAMFVPRRPQPQRRGSSASVDLVRGELSPSNTPPLVGHGSVGSKKTQYPPMKMSLDGKWKPGGEQPSNPPLVIHPFEYQNVDSSQPVPPAFSSASGVPMIPPSSHVIQPGYPGMAITHSRLPKGRGEMVIGGGRGSPRGISDKPKLRMHHVRDDDFKQPVKPDRRRKRWRGKNKDSYLSVRAEEAEASLHRMGKVGEPMGSLPPFPQVMAMETDRRGVPEKYPTQRDGAVVGMPKPPQAPGARTKDGNYALNMLADMSSIQSKERPDGAMIIPMPTKGNRTNESASNNIPPPVGPSTTTSEPGQHPVRSPVSLAARSLLMLGEDMNQNQNVTHVENTAATSLLQLSGAVVSEEDSKSQKEGEGINEHNPDDSAVGQTTRSASFSAAEAMIMMGSASEHGKESTSNTGSYTEVFETSRNGQHPPPSSDVMKTPSERTKPGSMRSRRPHSISLDSEVTDTDSEATLTPDSPNLSKARPPDLIGIPQMSVDNDESTEEVLLQSSLHGIPTSQCDDENKMECEGGKGGAGDSSNGALKSIQPSVWVHEDGKILDPHHASVVDHPNMSTTTASANLVENGSRKSGDSVCESNYHLIAGSAPAIPATTRLTVTGTFTPPPPTTSLPNDLLEGNKEVDKAEESQSKLPKFISTFGPISESVEQSLPVEIDGGNREERVDDSGSSHSIGSNSPSLAGNTTVSVSAGRKGSGANSVDSVPDFSPKETSKSLKDGVSDDIIPNSTTSSTLLTSQSSLILPTDSPQKMRPPTSTSGRTKQQIKIKQHNNRVAPVTNSTGTEVTASADDAKSNTLPSWTAFANTLDHGTGGRERADSDVDGKLLEQDLSDDGSDTSSMTDGILSSGEVNKVIETIDEGLAQSPTTAAVGLHSDGTDSTPEDDPSTVSRSSPSLAGNKTNDSLQHTHNLHESIQANSKVDQEGQLMQIQNPGKSIQGEKRHFSPGLENSGGNGKGYRALGPSKGSLDCATQSAGHRDYDRQSSNSFLSSQQTKSRVASYSDTASTINKSRVPSRHSPAQDAHVASLGKAAERFSPLSDDDVPELSHSSPRPMHRGDSYSRVAEVEESEKRQKRYQLEYYDSSASLVPSPASSTSSSSTKRHHSHHRHHHRHQERFSGGELPISNKRDHHREKSASTSRGSSPADRKKDYRHRHHHHHSSQHHRHHSRDSHSSHEGAPKGDHLVGTNAPRFSKEGWHEGNAGKNRKRVYMSSDEEDAMLPEFTGGQMSTFKPSIKRKMKHSREHKERWKEHKHGLHKH